jgi:hypothetical protein
MKLPIVAVSIGVLILFLANCDLFRTRPTEPPNSGGTSWVYPQSIDRVFINLSQSIEELNAEHYLWCIFSPDDSSHIFEFKPNPGMIGWPLSSPWGYTEEQETVQRLFSLMPLGSAGFLTLQEDGRLVYPSQDSAWVSQTYNLVMPVTDPTLPQEVTGKADFYLAKNATGYWAIYRWEDLEGSPSWTDLRAGLY